MASIPDVEPKPTSSSANDQTETPQMTTNQEKEPQTTTKPTHDTPSTSQAIETDVEVQVENIPDKQDNTSGVKASDDTRYRKYFKMLQFGVPAPAVKLKMANEGFDQNVLE